MSGRRGWTTEISARKAAAGRYELYALCAAMVDRRIKGVSAEEGINGFGELIRSDFYEQDDVMLVILPGLLRYADLPELRRAVRGCFFW